MPLGRSTSSSGMLPTGTLPKSSCDGTLALPKGQYKKAGTNMVRFLYKAGMVPKAKAGTVSQGRYGISRPVRYLKAGTLPEGRYAT